MIVIVIELQMLGGLERNILGYTPFFTAPNLRTPTATREPLFSWRYFSAYFYRKICGVPKTISQCRDRPDRVGANVRSYMPQTIHCAQASDTNLTVETVPPGMSKEFPHLFFHSINFVQHLRIHLHIQTFWCGKSLDIPRGGRGGGFDS